jgi:hypothetical protein
VNFANTAVRTPINIAAIARVDYLGRRGSGTSVRTISAAIVRSVAWSGIIVVAAAKLTPTTRLASGVLSLVSAIALTTVRRHRLRRGLTGLAAAAKLPAATWLADSILSLVAAIALAAIRCSCLRCWLGRLTAATELTSTRSVRIPAARCRLARLTLTRRRSGMDRLALRLSRLTLAGALASHLTATRLFVSWWRIIRLRVRMRSRGGRGLPGRCGLVRRWRRFVRRLTGGPSRLLFLLFVALPVHVGGGSKQQHSHSCPEPSG